MYGILALKKESQDFISRINVSNLSRSKSISLAIAKALSNSLSLPVTAVDNLSSYLNMEHTVTINSLLSAINEFLPIDVETIKDYIKRFYTFRYNLVHANKYTIALNEETAIVDFFGISKSFDPDTLSLIKIDHKLLTSYISNFNRILDEIKKD